MTETETLRALLSDLGRGPNPTSVIPYGEWRHEMLVAIQAQAVLALEEQLNRQNPPPTSRLEGMTQSLVLRPHGFLAWMHPDDQRSDENGPCQVRGCGLPRGAAIHLGPGGTPL